MKKHHWHAFRHEKLFEKQPQPHCQTYPECCGVRICCRKLNCVKIGGGVDCLLQKKKKHAEGRNINEGGGEGQSLGHKLLV
jgi:hypothetical protein